MIRRQRIIGVHLLNDFSGSPFVFSQALRTLESKEYEVHLFTATPSGQGFLTGLKGIAYHTLFYRWSPVKLITLLFFCLSQLSLFFRLLFFVQPTDVLYINSMLPFGAALAGKCKKCEIIYHIHEVSIQPAPLKNFLLFVIKKTAIYCLYVSKYLKEYTPISVDSSVVYNSLPAAFIETAKASPSANDSPFVVLMLCSLKKYKGVFEFIACARQLNSVRFELVLNATQEEIDKFFDGFSIPANAILYPAQQNVHPFYQRASLVVNLSLINEWVETFGMTILEAMNYKLPVIIPPTGGITELVNDGVNGFLVDAHNGKELRDKIMFLSTHQEDYKRMSEAAERMAKLFGPQNFELSIADHFATRAASQFSYKQNSLSPH